MKKICKRALALLLAVIALGGAFAVKAAAKDYSGTCGKQGKNLTWSLDTETGLLNIGGSGEMMDYTVEFTAPWCDYRDAVRSVEIGSGVTDVGAHAFDEFTNLTSVVVGSGVVRIGANAFCGCKRLKSVTLGENVADIGDYAFGGCKALNGISLPDSVTQLGNFVFNGTAYYDNTGNWTNGVLYNGCALISVKSSVKGAFTVRSGTRCIAGSAFAGCNSITGVTIPEGVRSIGSSAFERCENLNSITAPDSLIYIGAAAFAGTGYYKNENNWNKNVLYLGKHLIATKTSLKGAYTVPPGTRCIADSAFAYCAGLTSITIPDSVIRVGSRAFAACSGLTDALVGSGAETVGEEAFAQCVKLARVKLGGVESIERGAFYGCNGLVEATLPAGITDIREFAFGGCEKLADVYYAGSRSRWDLINIRYGNSGLAAARVHYNWNGGTPSHDHSYVSVVTKQPTCTEPGVKTCTCSCGDCYTEPVPAVGHSFTKYVYNNDATTENDGTKTAKCDRCSATDTVTAPGTRLKQTTVSIRNYTANKTVDYKTTITFSAEVREPVSGGQAHWFIDGQDKGAGDTYTVSKAKKSFTVQVKYIKDGKTLAESGVESVNVKTGFFAKLAAFFRSIFGGLPKVVQGWSGVEIAEKILIERLAY